MLGYKDTEIRYKGRRFFSASPLCAVIVDYAKLKEYSHFIEQRENGRHTAKSCDTSPSYQRAQSPIHQESINDCSDSPSGFAGSRKRFAKRTQIAIPSMSSSSAFGSDPIQFLTEFNSLVGGNPTNEKDRPNWTKGSNSNVLYQAVEQGMGNWDQTVN